MSHSYTNSPCPKVSSVASPQTSFLLQTPAPVKLTSSSHRGLNPEVSLYSSSLFSPTPKYQLVTMAYEHFLGNTLPLPLPIYSHCPYHWPSLDFQASVQACLGGTASFRLCSLSSSCPTHLPQTLLLPSHFSAQECIMAPYFILY